MRDWPGYRRAVESITQELRDKPYPVPGILSSHTGPLGNYAGRLVEYLAYDWLEGHFSASQVIQEEQLANALEMQIKQEKDMWSVARTSFGFGPNTSYSLPDAIVVDIENDVLFVRHITEVKTHDAGFLKGYSANGVVPKRTWALVGFMQSCDGSRVIGTSFCDILAVNCSRIEVAKDPGMYLRISLVTNPDEMANLHRLPFTREQVFDEVRKIVLQG